jgi:hypothetical protein
MRTRKPWVRFRRRLFGWNVLFIGEPHGPRRRNAPHSGTNSGGYRSGGRLSNGRNAAGRVALYTPGSSGTFPRSRISHNCGLLHGSQPHFSTTVEISVQKGCSVTDRPHPSWAPFVTC